MADEYIKRKDIVSALWIALYAYEDKTEKQFKEDPNLETGEWFDHRIFVQACHAECLEEVLAIPSADVEEVKYGKWVENSRTSISERHRQIHYSIYKCSICNHANGRYKSNFCPNCGADMREES